MKITIILFIFEMLLEMIIPVLTEIWDYNKIVEVSAKVIGI